MSYIDNNLLEGEQVLYKSRHHKIIFIWPVMWILFAISFFALGEYVLPEFIFFAGFFVVVSAIHAFAVWTYFISAEFAITNLRVVAKEGFVKRKTMEVLLNRVESIKVNQGVMGRILNYGTVTISGTGGVSDPIEKLRSPLEFKGKIQQQLAGLLR